MTGTRETLRSAVEAKALEAVFALAPIGVTLTRDGVTEYCNPVYLSMFGYDGHQAEIYGKSLLAMVAPDRRDDIGRKIRQRQRGEDVESSYESVGLRRDGSQFPFWVSVRRVVLADGPATLAFFVDLSERQRIEEDLRQSNEKLNALIRACPVPVMMLDVGGRVQLWNPAAERTFGWSADEALGRPHPIVGACEQAEFERNVLHALSGGLEGVEARRHKKDGTPVDIAIWAAPVHGAEGSPVGAIALTVDVTARRRTEEALRHSQEQLRHAQKMEAVGRLAGGVAHDFNNVLMAISAFAELLSTQVAHDEPASANVTEIQRAVGRAAMLTRQLLAFSRQQQLSVEILDLNEVVLGMKGMLSRLIGHEIHLEMTLDPELARVRADLGQLEQVMANLAVNAKDAMPGGGRLSLTTANVDLLEPLVSPRVTVPAGRWVTFQVADTGTGMCDEVLSRMFEPFFTTKERGKGTGLGLSTVYGIVTQSGGQLVVESQPGEGSVFRVYLPRVEELPA